MKYMTDGRPLAAEVNGAERGLTTTSFAILGLLSAGPMSTYEITWQMKRGLRNTWPRAETRCYQEPKNLVAHGLATAAAEPTGRRRRTVYSITDRGRHELRHWLAAESAPPQFQSEALLRVTFADGGTKDALLETLRGLRQEGQAMQERLGEQAADYLATGGPFPERLHLIAVIGRFLSDYALLLDDWAAWAEDAVSTWPGTALAESSTPMTTDVFNLLQERARSSAPPAG